jgi:hypothetical protein
MATYTATAAIKGKRGKGLYFTEFLQCGHFILVGNPAFKTARNPMS